MNALHLHIIHRSHMHPASPSISSAWRPFGSITPSTIRETLRGLPFFLDMQNPANHYSWHEKISFPEMKYNIKMSLSRSILRISCLGLIVGTWGRSHTYRVYYISNPM